ncbi:hypothetical protein BEH94_02895 [Candidatus Altiarchaeales archaeon WOR_SM1_SCG]|nr:hypothetical protein BEH94_02895 [Candidatus Altiarchaeales archaeon WOR_SM1_SCG]
MTYKTEVVEVDSKGRFIIPGKIRKMMRIEKFIKVNYAEDHIDIRPMEYKRPVKHKDVMSGLEGSLSSQKTFPELRKTAENLFIEESKKHLLKNVD